MRKHIVKRLVSKTERFPLRYTVPNVPGWLGAILPLYEDQRGKIIEVYKEEVDLEEKTRREETVRQWGKYMKYEPTVSIRIGGKQPWQQ